MVILLCFWTVSPLFLCFGHWDERGKAWAVLVAVHIVGFPAASITMGRKCWLGSQELQFPAHDLGNNIKGRKEKKKKNLLLTLNILLWLDSSSIGLGDRIDLLLIMQNIQWMAKMLLKGAHGTL